MQAYTWMFLQSPCEPSSSTTFWEGMQLFIWESLFLLIPIAASTWHFKIKKYTYTNAPGRRAEQ